MMRPISVFLALLVVPTSALAVTIPVSPGPGTPLQDAIDAASPGATLLLQAGTFHEAIVINKPLTLTSVRTGIVNIDAGSTSASLGVDIQSDGVQIKGQSPHRAAGEVLGPLYILGGNNQTELIRIGPNARIVLYNLVVGDGHSPAQALVLNGSTGVRVENSYFDTAGTTGVHLTNIPLGAKILLRGDILSSYYGSSGLRAGLFIENSGIGTTRLGKGGISVQFTRRPILGGYGTTEAFGETRGIKIANASGVFVKGVGPNISDPDQSAIACGTPGCTALSLDASSRLNLFENVVLDPTNGGINPSGGIPVDDLGTGNCGRRITYVEGPGTLAVCR